MADKMSVTVEGDLELANYFKTFPVKSNIIVSNVIKEKALKIERQYVLNLKRNYKTGGTENTVFSRISKFFAIIGSNSIVALWLEFGTKRHDIEIKNKKVLTDKVDFFGKKVTHPGTKAYLPMTRAYLKHIGVFGQHFISELKSEFKRKL
jgi:hypothetical protein